MQTQLPRVPASIAVKPNYVQVEREAERVLRDAHINRPPVPIKRIIEDCGIDVVFSRFMTKSDTVAGFVSFTENKIYVNADDAVNRQTFTMAHEFGHWTLHRDLFLKDPNRYHFLMRQPTGAMKADPLEKEANAFAARVLVPTRMFAPLKGAPAHTLAAIFAVSEDVIKFRSIYA